MPYRLRVEQYWRNVFRRGLLPASGVVALLLGGCTQFGNAQLQFTPSSFPTCKGPNIVVDVSWDATSRTKQPIHLMVNKPGGQPRLWIEAPPKGHRKTPKWMSDGTTMQLRNAHGKLLAERTLTTTACSRATGGKSDH